MKMLVSVSVRWYPECSWWTVCDDYLSWK